MAPQTQIPKGSGIGFVVVQGFLLAVLFFGPSYLNTDAGIAAPNGLLLWLGYGIFILGVVIALIAAINLGKNLTPLPKPKDNAELIQGGLYRFVRHPIYFGVIMLSVGWGLIQQSTLIWLYVVIIAIFFDIKSRKEEEWLQAKFSAYADYQGRVRKLIPWVY
jgi:protein-S-isoprenylcysteine O-methyltransferase Ste14